MIRSPAGRWWHRPSLSVRHDGPRPAISIKWWHPLCRQRDRDRLGGMMDDLLVPDHHSVRPQAIYLLPRSHVSFFFCFRACLCWCPIKLYIILVLALELLACTWWFVLFTKWGESIFQEMFAGYSRHFFYYSAEIQKGVRQAMLHWWHSRWACARSLNDDRWRWRCSWCCLILRLCHNLCKLQSLLYYSYFCQ